MADARSPDGQAATASDARAGIDAAAAGAVGNGGGKGRVVDPGVAGDGDVVINGPYAPGADSVRQAGVTPGKLMGGFSVKSAVYAHTFGYSVHVPAAYDPAKPAAVMVFLDGDLYRQGDYRADVIIDNLVARRQIPVVLAVFVGPYQRREEYDAVTDAFARFAADELLVDVAKHFSILADPRAHAIAGHSSGGVAAFVAAWHRPDAFAKSMGHNTSIHNYLGADKLPDVVAAAPAKAIRVSLMSGTNDRADFGPGNKRLAAALKQQGYHYRLVWGDMNHDSPAVAQTMPDALRWLWRDLPVE
jgi:enterochelin esterase family protein